MDPTACVFCELLADRGHTAWVARRPQASAFLPVPEGRLSPAHTLIVPNDHAVGIHDASPRSLRAVMLLAQEVARAMTTSIGARGVNILNASGPDSGQSVPHLHLHLVPRWESDGLDTWPSSVSGHRLEDRWLASVRAALEE